ncbi:Pr6Pr family membrane protein [Epilithonimonas zeae]|uniref:Pr6Pr family membrane protein n=1 Tax=Epilithonimonas zeae TaxID=1416779 RepID=UPI00200F77EB|nr:Pr6Pr family membrane protein [Epilithonimonas zeae]UQB67911.1 Pr6Pr family membrane protein [Epilithonimonas zeae]
MKQKLALFLAILGWIAVILQFYLMMESRTISRLESVIRFFSYFTILTNMILAISFSIQTFKKETIRILTPITVYITIVGLVYQILLRHTWSPTGLQMIVDELLHSVIPGLAILYWYLYEDNKLNYHQIPKWLIFPLVYLFYILIRGYYSGFYPYPFVDVSKFGLNQVLVNSGLLIVLFILFCALFIWIKKLKSKARK